MQTLKTGHYTFYSNTIWQYGLQLVKYVLPLLTLPYLTRVLEPEGYAVYAYVVSFMSFVQTFVDFGFNLSGTKSVARAGNSAELGLITGRITQARLMLCVLTGVVCVFIGMSIPIIRSNTMYSVLSFIAVCGRALAPDFLFQGKEQMGPITIRYLVSKTVSTVLTFVLVQTSEDLLWVPILDIFASLIALIWSFSAAKKLFRLVLKFDALSAVFDELLKSAYYCLSNMASTAFSGVTTLIIGFAITDPVQISYWSLAMTAVSAVQALYAPITNSLYPHMVAGQDFHFARKLIQKSIFLVLPGTVLFYFLSDFIVMILGGQEYSGASRVLQLVSPVLFFSFYGLIAGWPILGAMGRVRELTRTTVISSFINIVLLVLLTVTGQASVASFAIVRNITEASLCYLRLLECKKANFRLI